MSRLRERTRALRTQYETARAARRQAKEAREGEWCPMTEPPPADIPHGVALVFAHFDTVQLTARAVDPFTWARDPANVMLDNAGAYAWTLLALPPNAVDEWMRECTPALKESA